ncbi:hypothetical protein H257_00056 [Aphanomyces astaci]|uniref:Uncharacterized protein n=1 Tax=Aphanomyces astaci TaxID=112090 RepID=W4H8S9_APHAT|nr:hypothetical protein H257_00056 [Aphanomyces astaci]ETV88450.1 hypothetical protein H257_00056 [Aphanomyces astaci]|eukprot:XP_009820850.1 hypothetical protein H257_00056 [Aphanomyces astaci]
MPPTTWIMECNMSMDNPDTIIYEDGTTASWTMDTELGVIDDGNSTCACIFKLRPISLLDFEGYASTPNDYPCATNVKATPRSDKYRSLRLSDKWKAFKKRKLAKSNSCCLAFPFMSIMSMSLPKQPVDFDLQLYLPAKNFLSKQKKKAEINVHGKKGTTHANLRSRAPEVQLKVEIIETAIMSNGNSILPSQVLHNKGSNGLHISVT